MQSTRLLIVDDDTDLLDTLTRRFKFKGYNVSRAGNGEEALAYLEDHPVDIVISDIQMPQMDGLMLLKRIKKEYPMIHVIMMTGYISQSSILECMRHGADICLFKPMPTMDELDDAIHTAEAALKKWRLVFERLAQMNTREDVS
jgi:DNA-binding NtrC family response regulator